jgi:protein-L-isoaspartate(D-aspartate) O-methyltransferase
VIPIGDGRRQTLQRITRTAAGFDTEKLEPVVFVPLLGGVSEG